MTKKNILDYKIFSNRLSPLYAVTVSHKMMRGNAKDTLWLIRMVKTAVGLCLSTIVKPTPVGRIKETQAAFRYALTYYGFETEEQVRKQMRVHSLWILYFSVILIAQVSYGTYLMFNHEMVFNNSVMQFVYSYMLTPLITSIVVRHAFYYSQIKHRRLFTFWHWLKDPLLTFKAAEPVLLSDQEYQSFLEDAQVA